MIEGDDCGDVPVRLDAGSFFHGPRGRIHGFHNEGTETAKLLIFISPGSGIEAMFAGLAELTRQSTEIDPAKVAAVCGNYGIEFMPPAQGLALPQLMPSIATRKRTGGHRNAMTSSAFSLPSAPNHASPWNATVVVRSSLQWKPGKASHCACRFSNS
jgi:hypothetical protein